MYGDSCRMKSLGKTPHGGAEGGLAAPAKKRSTFPKWHIYTKFWT